MEEKELLAAAIMKTDVITINPDNTLEEALDILSSAPFSGLPVVDETGRIVGMLSKTDIISGVLKDADRSPSEMIGGMIYRFLRGKVDPTRLEDVCVSEVMTRRLHTAKPSTTVHEVAELMTRYEINRVPVVDEDKKLVGIISRSDLLDVLSQLA
jgi:CBS domain-containing protein